VPFRNQGGTAIITARDLLGGEPVTHRSEARVVLFTRNKTHHDTDDHGPRRCEVYVTPSRLLLFHELAFGWWGHDYAFEQFEDLEKDGKTLTLRTHGHSARIELPSAAERDALYTALTDARAGVEPVAVTSDDRLAAEAKVRALRKLLDEGKLSQAEYDEKAIELLGIGGGSTPSSEPSAEQTKTRLLRLRR
jgi:hypothetical protein